MKYFKCERCLRLLEAEHQVGLAVDEVEDNGDLGSYIYYAEICKNCAKEILKEFKIKIDISNDWKKEFKQNLIPPQAKASGILEATL